MGKHRKNRSYKEAMARKANKPWFWRREYHLARLFIRLQLEGKK